LRCITTRAFVATRYLSASGVIASNTILILVHAPTNPAGTGTSRNLTRFSPGASPAVAI